MSKPLGSLNADTLAAGSGSQRRHEQIITDDELTDDDFEQLNELYASGPPVFGDGEQTQAPAPAPAPVSAPAPEFPARGDAVEMDEPIQATATPQSSLSESAKQLRDQRKANQVAQVGPDAKSDRAVLAQAASNRRAIDKGYQAKVGEDNIFTGKKSRSQRLKTINNHHSMYSTTMAANCLAPLDRGIDMSAIMQVCTTAAVMWCMSPQFRQQLGKHTPKVDRGLTAHRDTVVDKIKASSFWGSVSQRDQANRKATEATAEWDNRRNLVENTTERVPMSTDSAARTWLNVSDMAYEAMRTPGHDAQEVAAAYSESMEDLREQWSEDGLDQQAVTDSARDLVAQRMAVDPGYAARFTETSHGLIRPWAQTMTPGRYGKDVAVWNKAWAFAAGGRVDPASEMFTPREPGDVALHATETATSLAIDLHQVGSESGVDAMRDVLVGYSSSWATRHSIAGAGVSPGTERDHRVAANRRAQGCLVSMAEDGVPANLRRDAMDWSVEQALEAVARDHPELHAEFTEAHGKTWQEDARSFIAEVKKESRPLRSEFGHNVRIDDRVAQQDMSLADTVDVSVESPDTPVGPEVTQQAQTIQAATRDSVQREARTQAEEIARRARRGQGVIDPVTDQVGRAAVVTEPAVTKQEAPVVNTASLSGVEQLTHAARELSASSLPSMSETEILKRLAMGNDFTALRPLLQSLEEHGVISSESETSTKRDILLSAEGFETWKAGIEQRVTDQQVTDTPAVTEAPTVAETATRSPARREVADVRNREQVARRARRQAMAVAMSGDERSDSAATTREDKQVHSQPEVGAKNGMATKGGAQWRKETQGAVFDKNPRVEVVASDVATTAQRQQIESFNNDYANAGSNPIKVDYDSPTSVDVTETKGMSDSMAVSRRTQRVKHNQIINAQREHDKAKAQRENTARQADKNNGMEFGG